MSREIDVTKANEWDDQEVADNIAYLEARGRTDEVAQIRNTVGVEAPPQQEPKTAQQLMEEGGTTVFDTATMTVDQVLDQVGDDPAAAQQALDSENARGDDARVTLVEKLEALVEEG